MRPDRHPPFVVLLACAGFVPLLFGTVGPLGVGPGRPLELIRADDAAPHSSEDAEAAHVVANLTPAEAVRLQGRRAKYLIVLDGPATAVGDRVVYEVVVPGANELGTVWLAAG
jgi:hypothetical protein